MRLFVTAAEDDRLAARHEGEVARLREDREKELARLTDLGPVVTYLREEVDFWRTAFREEQQRTRHEQQRAEVAIDQCRAAHGRVGPATVAPMPATLQEAERVASMQAVQDNPVIPGLGGLGLE